MNRLRYAMGTIVMVCEFLLVWALHAIRNPQPAPTPDFRPDPADAWIAAGGVLVALLVAWAVMV
jgi:hypothetical protein